MDTTTDGTAAAGGGARHQRVVADLLACGAVLVRVLRDPALAAAWERPSALPSWSTGGVAAHAARALHTVLAYLDADPPGSGVAAPVDAAGYVLAVLPDERLDVDDDLQRGIRGRGDAAAVAGPEGVADAADAALGELARRLPGVDPDHRIAVRDGVVTTLGEYLVTRVVELVVHLDDLAAGLPQEVEVPPSAAALAADALVDVARRRRGDLVLVRALARRERVEGPVAL